MTQGAFALPIAPGESFVNQRNHLRIGVIRLREKSSGFERGLENPEEFRTDGFLICDGSALRFQGPAFNREGHSVLTGAKGNCVAVIRCSHFDSGNRGQATNHFAEKRRALFGRAIRIHVGVVRNRQPNLRSQQAVRIKSGVDFQ